MAQSEMPDGAAEAAAPISGVERGSSGDEAAIASNYCPRCFTRLASRSCKLICPTCGYYMSCSDFY